jgi:hypothetical protein
MTAGWWVLFGLGVPNSLFVLVSLCTDDPWAGIQAAVVGAMLTRVIPWRPYRSGREATWH